LPKERSPRALGAGFELFAQQRARQIFDRAGLAVGAVVDEREQLAAGACEHVVDRGSNGRGRGQVESQGFEAERGEAHQVFFLAHARKDPVAARLEPDRQAAADAARAAGDQYGVVGCHDFAGENSARWGG